MACHQSLDALLSASIKQESVSESSKMLMRVKLEVASPCPGAEDSAHLYPAAVAFQRNQECRRNHEPKQPMIKLNPKRNIDDTFSRSILSSGRILTAVDFTETRDSLNLKGRSFSADLTPQGIIFFNNTHKFHSPSSFSMHIIRMLNPERNLDNGWQTVKYCGRVLRTFKKQYLTDKQLVQGQSLAPEGSRAKRCRNVEPFSNLKTLEHSSRAVVRLSCNKPAQISKPFVASERKILNLTPIKPNLKPLAAVFPSVSEDEEQQISEAASSLFMLSCSGNVLPSNSKR